MNSGHTKRYRSFGPHIALMWAVGVATVIFLVAFAFGCGGDDSSYTIKPLTTPGDWFTATDTSTGRSFRCVIWSSSGIYGRGITSFCYEPYQGAGE